MKRATLQQKKLERQSILAAEEEKADLAQKKPKANKPSGVRKIVIEEPVLKTDAAPDGLAWTEDDIEKHPERRFKHALKEFEETELKNFRAQYPGLRLSQLKQLIYKEFQKSPKNPFNQSNVVAYNVKLDQLNSKQAEEQDDDLLETDNAELDNTVSLVNTLAISSY